jgi:hypothetical protein
MSIWFFGRRRQGRRWLYSVEIPYMLLPLLLALAMAFLLPLLAWLRAR